jgi:hypothetical protein
VKKVKITKVGASSKTKRHAGLGNSARTSQKADQTAAASSGASAFAGNGSAGSSNSAAAGKSENIDTDSENSRSGYTVSSNKAAAAHIKSTGSSVEDLRQKYILALSELDSQYEQNKDMYNPEVKKEIEQARSAVLLRLQMLQTPYQAADAANYYTSSLVGLSAAPDTGQKYCAGKQQSACAEGFCSPPVPGRNAEKQEEIHCLLLGIIQNTRAR